MTPAVTSGVVMVVALGSIEVADEPELIAPFDSELDPRLPVVAVRIEAARDRVVGRRDILVAAPATCRTARAADCGKRHDEH
jgi:hypothetical protein